MWYSEQTLEQIKTSLKGLCIISGIRNLCDPQNEVKSSQPNLGLVEGNVHTV